jgi:hypothetical protein
MDTLCLEIHAGRLKKHGRWLNWEWLTAEPYVYVANQNDPWNIRKEIVAINMSLKLVDNVAVAEKSAPGER